MRELIFMRASIFMRAPIVSKSLNKLLPLMLTGVVSANAVASGGHFLVDDGSVTPRNTCQLETWITRTSPVTTMTLAPACNFSAAAEWSLPTTYNLRTDEFSEIGLQRKAMLFGQRRGPSVAWSAGVNYSLSTDRVSDIYINFPVSLQVAESVVMHLNAGALYDRFDRETYATWGAATNIKVSDGPLLIAEIVGDDERDPIIGAGLRFHMGATSWTLDLGVSRDTGPGKNSYIVGLNIPSIF
jgi:hypothetical protein